MSQASGESVLPPETSAAGDASEREYGFSALFSALGRMWRGTAPALVAIVLNALVQSLLTYWNPSIGLNFGYIVALVLSFAALVFCGGLLARTALGSVQGKVSLGDAMAGTVANLPTIVLWLTVLVVLVTIGTLLHPVVAWLILAVLAFVPLAAADGKANALGVNFKALGERWGRWLLTVVVVLIIAVVIFLLSAVNVLFVKGFPASLISWLAYGLLAWWILTAWAEIYRSTKVGRAA